MPTKVAKTPVKKTPVKKVVAKEVAPKAPVKLPAFSVPTYSLLGKESTPLALPKEIFGAPINKALLKQAMRVYMTNQKSLLGSTKTRGDVTGSTAKIFRQKGTGRARHGGIRAPIFVGGGITFGPKSRKVTLDLPKKMKKAALISALSSKMFDKNVFGVIGLDKATGKTKEVANFLQVLGKKSVLVVTTEKQDNVVRSFRNLKGVVVMPVTELNAYEVIRHSNLLISKEAVEKLK